MKKSIKTKMMLRNSNAKQGKGISGRKRFTKCNSRDTDQILSRQENVDLLNVNVHRNVTSCPVQILIPDTSLATQTPVKRMEEDFRFAKELIPEFDGTKMSVIMFIEQCKAATALLEAHEMPYLIIIIKNKITGPARK